MELKVWVDGIQRVVCGVTDATTCHDVIIALANAMGRTGRFTLIEKWRDIERPLPPNEYPARALQKWGEYASEVKLHLCQSETIKKNVQHEKQHKNIDKFSHAFSPPDPSQTSESLIKRSSTFSGSHNLNPLPKSHRDQLTARLQPIVENRQSTGLHPLPHSSSCSPSFPHPIPSPRRKVSPHRTASPLRLPSPRNMLNHSPNTSTSPHNIVRPLPNRPYQNHNIHNDLSKFNVYSNHEHLEERGTDKNFPCQIDVRNNYISGVKSCSHQRDELVTIEHSLDSSGCSHSRSASLEIEEYDLDRNFPDILRDSNRTERPSIHTEYKLEPEVNIVHQGESEHDRLVRLVTVQLERIKTQESQIDMVDTEILSMEEKDIEYEEELEKITKEFVILEQKQREEESDLTHLESVSWHDEFSKSQKHDQELKLQLSTLNNKRQICEKQIVEEKLKESQFIQNIEVIKDDIEILKKKLSEEENALQVETGKLKIEISHKLTEGDELETNLKHVDQEIKSVDSVFAEKEKEIDKMEEELKEENIKCLEEPDSRVKDSNKTENREAILKILEGRLSPRPKSNQNDTMTSQAFINSLSTKNPNGVWV